MLPFGSPPQVRGKQVFYYRRRKQVGITPAGAGKTRAGRLTGWSFRYHPRRCGENHHPPVRHHRCGGSPPQVRGKHRNCRQYAYQHRITPAGAGKTPHEFLVIIANEDHPRRCGENFGGASATKNEPESPPQVRGKPASVSASAPAEGITPAGAGKTSGIKSNRPLPWDHPRRCGENFGERYEINCCIGSPPQVRGKLAAFLNSLPVIRITPAGAGKTYVEEIVDLDSEDHPRRCGENCADVPVQTGAKRITPAGAGKTRLQQRAQCQRRDHPRRCGENSAWGCIEYAHPGSPPQVRGKQSMKKCINGKIRITPAGAGKTILVQRKLFQLGDHPRRCGENAMLEAELDGNTGSPPQVRGKRNRAVQLFVVDRITPAGAGKTGSASAMPVISEDHPRRCGENMRRLEYDIMNEGSPPQMRGKLSAAFTTENGL